jgi:large subunit ribosomal protein L5
MSYDPQIGIYGMDINVILARRGVRIARRNIERHRLPKKQMVQPDDAIAFLKSRYSAEVA